MTTIWQISPSSSSDTGKFNPMRQLTRTVLAASISYALFVPATHAESSKDSNTMKSTQSTSSSDDDLNQEVVITSDKLEAVNGDKAVYSGNVKVTQGKKSISADTMTLHQQDSVAVAEGNVKMTDGNVEATSDKVTNNLNDDTFSLENTQYKFTCQQGRGEAAYIAKTGQAMYELEDGSITSCPEGDDSWRLVASDIKVDQNEEMATLINPRFEILNVPVAYFPYLTLPIGETRKSGFLFPSVSYGSDDGFETEVPYYWNIAPNLDLTFTTQYIQERGVKYNADFRYLTSSLGEGQISGEIINSDSNYSDERRWAMQFEHSGLLDKHWLIDVDYSKVSDNDYFQDFSTDIGSRDEGYLTQSGSVAYRSANWDMALKVKDFQVLEDDTAAYQMAPQLAYNYYAPLVRHLNFDVKSQATRFVIDDASQPDATRLHVEPGFSIPLNSTWATWTTEARYLSTYYHQDIDNITDSTLQSELNSEVSRNIPEFRSHAGVFFERPLDWFGGYTQSFEPQVQYLYIKNTDQSDIYNYDTTILQTDYYGLFRDRKYSSIDKIAAANQVSYGATTRFFDSDYKERANIAFGQIYYIDKDTKITDDDDASSYSSWAVEADFNFSDNLFYHGGVQYDVDGRAMQLANSTIEYQMPKGFVQANYRYVSLDYIEDNLSYDDYSTITSDGISQAGLVGTYQVTNRWSAAGQYYYDTTEHVSMEWLASVKYSSDCWYMTVSYSKQLTGWDGDTVGGTSHAEYDNNVGINFGIQGFATNKRNESAQKMLDDSDMSIEYGRPFYLSN